MEVKEIEVRNNERLNKLKNEQTQESKMNSGNHNQESVDEVLEKLVEIVKVTLLRIVWALKQPKGLHLIALVLVNKKIELK